MPIEDNESALRASHDSATSSTPRPSDAADKRKACLINLVAKLLESPEYADLPVINDDNCTVDDDETAQFAATAAAIFAQEETDAPPVTLPVQVDAMRATLSLYRRFAYLDANKIPMTVRMRS